MSFEATGEASSRKTPNVRVADQETLNPVNYNYFDAFVPTAGSEEAWSFSSVLLLEFSTLIQFEFVRPIEGKDLYKTFPCHTKGIVAATYPRVA